MKTLLILFEKLLIGRKRLQPFYEMLHRISLRGMNYDQAQSITKSGEIFAMRHAGNKIKTDNKIIFDIGGNKGEWSKIADEIFSNVSIYVFEPSLKLKKHLEDRFKNNTNIHFFAHGFSDSSGYLKLYNSGELIGTSYPKDLIAEYEEIAVNRVDQFCIVNNIDEIFYLKIDVEGNEFKVLQGCKLLLESKKIKFIQFEFGSNTIISRVFLKNFIDLLVNFRIYRIVKNGLIELNYCERYEIQLPQNILAELIV
jgi:FkbM family methyltransferase